MEEFSDKRGPVVYINIDGANTTCINVGLLTQILYVLMHRLRNLVTKSCPKEGGQLISGIPVFLPYLG